MASVKESMEKPSIDDFKLGQPLGEGNFSRIMVATHIATGEAFALKVIEKQRIKRLKVRHPNIFNEINMEKEVLNKLRHPNIIRLYQTFQDEAHLYFLLEYLHGGELLEQLVHEGSQVGVHEDLARFYLADIVNAVEYMHANKIMHRDLKPENMVVCARDGHLRLIDFGTAKDLENTALNGPNFVGTPEYMPPETVDNKETSYAGDIWALGCIAFQLLAGDTPFSGGSAYLTLLKVQSGSYVAPPFLSEAARDLIGKCLTKTAEERPSISEIKGHDFFEGIDFATHMSAQRLTVQFQNESLFELIRDLHEAEKQRTPKAPLAVGDGDIPRKLQQLSQRDRALLMHLLERKQLLHLPSIYPRFFSTPSHGRCVFARQGGYVGLTHNLQNQWSDTFSFMMVGSPDLGKLGSSAETTEQKWESDAAEFRRRVIAPVNAYMPAFVIICGDLVAASPGDTVYDEQATKCQELLNEIHPEVKLVFVPGINTFHKSCSSEARSVYSAKFGDDHFSFWHGGVKFVVVNSSLLVHESKCEVEARAQEEWLEKELENGKLCGRETVLLSAHAFHSQVHGPELPPHLAACMDNPLALEGGLTPTQKKRFVEMLAKNPPRLVVTTQGPQDKVFTVQTARNPSASGDEHDEAVAIKKTDMVVCSGSTCNTKETVIHVAQVAQSGISVTQVKASAPSKAASVAAPEDIEVSLLTSTAKLEISRGVAST